jgi:L-2-hydroxyglutarate oxidase LhgO
MQQTADFLIIGGGIVGLTLALEAKRRFPKSSVIVIDKEKTCGSHASGRNSGVLHAGFYYSADSLKARFTREGNRRLTQYCVERGLRINRCGKLVVARNTTELAGLAELLQRGKRNGVEVHEITEKEAREIEPRARTHEKALFSPTTSSVDPTEVIRTLIGDAHAAGVTIFTETAYVRKTDGALMTSRGPIAAGFVINAAGLYADKIARDFGFSKDYRILPFKGLYLRSDEPPGALRTNIYPVPDVEKPFLGVHFTVTVDGKIKIGPTAVPAFWREHYRGLGNFSITELFEVVGRELGMLLHNDFGFRSLAMSELRKSSKAEMAKLASELVSGVAPEHYRTWGPPGIRAQLVNIRKRKLEMDFRFEGDSRSLHVLNAVSPAFTCALPFSEHLFDCMQRNQFAA